MRSSALPRRAVLGAVLSITLVGAGMAAFPAHAACTPTYTDPAGDSAVGDPSTGPVTSDDDLDITAVTQSVDAGVFSTTVKVVKLSDTGPANSFIDRFTSSFTVAKKAVVFTFERDFSGAGSDKASATVGGTAVSAPVKLLVDLKASTIGASIAAADLEKAVGAPLSGEAFTAMSAQSKNAYPSNASPGTLQSTADTATAPATASYLFGTSSCGGAPSGGGSPAPGSSASPGSDTSTATIAISAPARVHTSDPEPLTATLKDSSGMPMAGKRITAQVGAGKAVAGTTNSTGQVKLAPVVVDKAGTRALVVRYAGSSGGAGKAEKRQNLAVLAEVAKLATRSSGTGSARNFMITLTDDDAVRHPYAGATLTVAYSGKSVTVTTNSAGQASLSIRSGTHVDIRYTGRPGYVQAATARTVV